MYVANQWCCASNLSLMYFYIVVQLFGPSPRRSRHSHVVRAQGEPFEKSVEIMRKFSEQYARKSGTYFCVDKGVTVVVIKHYDDKAAEVAQGLWNCPCVPTRERT